MRIGIDFRIYKTGIGRYTKNLINELAKVAAPEDEFVIFLRKDGYNDFSLPDERFKKALADFPPYSFAEQLRYLWVLKNENLDLMHFTNFNVPVLWPGKYVLTIHDLIHMSHSTFGSSTRNYLYYLIKRFVYGLVIRWVGWRSRIVIVPSEATKQDVVHYLRVPAAKVQVTYEGVESNFALSDLSESLKNDQSEKVLQKYHITKPFILYVATMYPHKNHVVLLEAFKLFREEISDLQLVLVGKVDYFSNQVKSLVNEMGLAKAVILPNFDCPDGYLPDDDLEVFYQKARLYVFPSLKEGFGIPILEAQAMGLPVACAEISCLPEIGGDSVLYFDPSDPVDIKNKIIKLIGDQPLRQQLIEKGYQNLTRFSWQQMAQQAYTVYKNV